MLCKLFAFKDDPQQAAEEQMLSCSIRLLQDVAPGGGGVGVHTRSTDKWFMLGVMLVYDCRIACVADV